MERLKEKFRLIILNEEKRTRLQFVGTYSVLVIVSAWMTIINIFTDKTLLMYSTLIFACLCLINLILTRMNDKCMRLASWLFTVEFIGLLTFFVVSGTPEGFSAIWAAMLPACGLLLFGWKRGTITSAVMFVILLFFFEVPFGRQFLQYEYTSSFMLRFPMLYLAFYLIALFLETIRRITFENYQQLYTHDALTGALNRHGFAELVTKTLRKSHSEKIGFMIFDLDHFKHINDTFGHFTGDVVLRQSAKIIEKELGLEICRWGGEEFAAIDPEGSLTPERIEEICRNFEKETITVEGQNIPLTVSIGAVIMNRNLDLTADQICIEADKCLYEAKETGRNKGIFRDLTDAVFDETLASKEARIKSEMGQALLNHQFVPYFQPQYNHSTGMLIGAEALVRWIHPKNGTVSPGDFIPVFEKTGFISKLDLYMFEEVCKFQAMCREKGYLLVPISANITRYDIYEKGFAEKLEEIRQKYNIPAHYLRLEITESAALGNIRYVNDFVRQLHSYGYVVEMDDFGSGYSSLSMLKDIIIDVMKLDMKFLEKAEDDGRGGTIVSSVIRMAKWLRMPVIAEGVETHEQAEFLKSVGCEFMQGYLFSRPLPAEDFEELLSQSRIGSPVPTAHLDVRLDVAKFWDPDSQETVFFNNFVGGAAVFAMHHDRVEVLRVNEKYLNELGMNLTEKEIIENDLLSMFDEENKAIFLDTLKRAVETGLDEECETWRDIHSECCGDETLKIRSTIRMIGSSEDDNLFFAMIRNITDHAIEMSTLQEEEKRMRSAFEQADVYSWEYMIATKEMRPCFRCMRVLKLPPLVRNYPEPLLETGIIPAENADEYRAFLKQLEEGAGQIEMVLPLTQERIPYHVRYTTEFDENGLPVKAYGSATKVVDQL